MGPGKFLFSESSPSILPNSFPCSLGDQMSPFMLSLDLSLPEERPIDLVLRSTPKEITKSLSHGAWSSAMYTRREPAGTSIGIPDSTSIDIIVRFFYEIAASIASLKIFH